jgi:hypothetical protein
VTVTFDYASHAYSIDGVRVPSVTQVLRDVLSPVQFGEQWHLDRGSANHAIYAMLADGVDPASIECDERSKPYMAGWLAWRDMWKPDAMQSEVRLHHPAMRYAGTADLVTRINGEPTIIDYKQTAGPLDALQMAGYALAYEATRRYAEINQAATLQIDGSGGYKFGPILRGAEWLRARNEWRSIMAVWHIKQRMG